MQKDIGIPITTLTVNGDTIHRSSSERLVPCDNMGKCNFSNGRTHSDGSRTVIVSVGGAKGPEKQRKKEAS